LAIDPDGSITLLCAKSEMGQGIFTTWAMVVAEELSVPVQSIRVEAAPADPQHFRDPSIGAQATWGSTGIAAFFDTIAEAAASTRQRLIAAAAGRWQVAAVECSVESGSVLHASSRRRLSYGDLAVDAAKLPPIPAKAKARAETSVIGRPFNRIDTSAKIDGSARFGLDVILPGMKTALLLPPPLIGATLLEFDAESVITRPGVRGVFATSAGVAIIADNFWAAKSAKSALRIVWRDPVAKHPDSASLRARYRNRLDEPGVLAGSAGSGANPPAAATSVSVEY
jgi:isoquinoline 1-oxidoreductase beta subunit